MIYPSNTFDLNPELMSAYKKEDKKLRHKGKSYAETARPKIAPGNEGFRDPNYMCTQLINMSFVRWPVI